MKNYLHHSFDYKKLVDVFDELPLWSAPFGLKLLDKIEYKHDIAALDIGCGTGFPLIELAMRLGSSSVVYGIDPWKEAIARINKKIEFYDITNIKMIEGVAEAIPLGDESVHLIVSNNGLNNVSDMEKSYSECRRIIKPDGQFIQTMNTNRSMFEFYDEFESVLTELNMPGEINKMKMHIYEKRRPVEEIKALLINHGFEIKELVEDEFSYKFTDGTAMLSHYFIRLAFMDSWVKILPDEKVESIFEMIEHRLNKKAALEGGMKLTIPFVLINAVKV